MDDAAFETLAARLGRDKLNAYAVEHGLAKDDPGWVGAVQMLPLLDALRGERTAVDDAIDRLSSALPSTDELVRRLKYVAALRGSLDVVAGALRNLTIDVGAILVVMVVLLAVGGVLDFRLAYQFGARSDHQACVVLTHTKSLAIQHEHLQSVEDLSAAISAICR